MRAFGADLIEHGRDFDEARVHSHALAEQRGLLFVGPFERELVAGVASYALELFRAAGEIDRVYVPIGCGSGICGTIAVRDALGLRTAIVGVVSKQANAYAQSFRAGRAIETERAATMADGVAVRVPVESALAAIRKGAEDVVEVDDADIEQAMRDYFDDTHQVAEGAGAAPLAALMQWSARQGKRVALILSGGNVDRDVFARVLGAR
jgi:threonine dehydratase